jgi:PAS domain S-box-containing protein
MSPALKDLFPLMLEQMREYGILLLDPGGAVLWMNVPAQEIFGHKLENVAGKNARFFFVPEDAANGVLEHEMATAAAHGSMENDRWMLRADGSRFWADGATFSLRGAGRELAGYSKILRNRTDLRQQLDTLRNEIASWIERDGQKNTVLAVASHELRNPLFATTVAVDTIRRVTSGTPEVEQPFGIIDRQLKAIQRLLDDITDAVQVNTGRLKLKREHVDLRAIIKRAVETMRPAVDSRRHIVQEILLPAPIPVEGDTDRLEQVVNNLVDNAIKYTPPGGQIAIEATIEGSEAVLKIDDNGIGIPSDMQAHIFDLFTQVPRTENSDERGLGIGLSLVKNLVAQHGGTIQVRSNGPGKGSEFSVRLPLAASNEQSAS